MRTGRVTVRVSVQITQSEVRPCELRKFGCLVFALVCTICYESEEQGIVLCNAHCKHSKILRWKHFESILMIPKFLPKYHQPGMCIRKIASHVARVAPPFSSKPHPTTLPQTMVGTLYIWWRLSRHNHLWHHNLTIISLWGHKLSSELFLHTVQISIKITILYYYAISLQKRHVVQM